MDVMDVLQSGVDVVWESGLGRGCYNCVCVNVCMVRDWTMQVKQH